jgi:hypothetical protein
MPGYVLAEFFNSEKAHCLEYFTDKKLRQIETYDEKSGRLRSIKHLDDTEGGDKLSTVEYFDSEGKLEGKFVLSKSNDTEFSAQLTKYDKNGNAVSGNKISISNQELVQLDTPGIELSAVETTLNNHER